MTDQTMMERLFGALEQLDEPTMIDTLFGSMAAMSIKQRGEAIDAMVKAARPKSEVQKVMCGTGFRYRVYMLDTLAAFDTRNVRGTFDSAARVDEFDTVYGRLK
ncbi:hypothetical protein B0G69_1187 [Paraburkholderia sp. RAU2J]|uniref:hypothetical protein n=1 Tax=Paraburkholderia sp. RAU2J TaxID=1938810 RepID=UPI000EB3C755|nr:hypothetical protein [Paraburkholderia sp. RAU2J]RKT25471.1 hypothetical protein B0G69_1187 [Paraburkholderia sp. RAU2J]